MPLNDLAIKRANLTLRSYWWSMPKFASSHDYLSLADERRPL